MLSEFRGICQHDQFLRLRCRQRKREFSQVGDMQQWKEKWSRSGRVKPARAGDRRQGGKKGIVCGCGHARICVKFRSAGKRGLFAGSDSSPFFTATALLAKISNNSKYLLNLSTTNSGTITRELRTERSLPQGASVGAAHKLRVL